MSDDLAAGGVPGPKLPGPWVQDFMSAICRDCEWLRRTDTVDERDGRKVLVAARRHARVHTHYVQVENGRTAHYREGSFDAG